MISEKFRENETLKTVFGQPQNRSTKLRHILEPSESGLTIPL